EELVELRSGVRAANLDIQAAGVRLRVVAVDRQDPRRPAHANLGGIGDVAVDRARALQKAALDVGGVRRERAVERLGAGGLRVIVAAAHRQSTAAADGHAAGVAEAASSSEVA